MGILWEFERNLWFCICWAEGPFAIPQRSLGTVLRSQNPSIDETIVSEKSSCSISLGK